MVFLETQKLNYAQDGINLVHFIHFRETIMIFIQKTNILIFLMLIIVVQLKMQWFLDIKFMHTCIL